MGQTNPEAKVVSHQMNLQITFMRSLKRTEPSMLASADDVTPFLGGVALADQWEVPTANRFIWKRGHFSTGLGIGADAGPIRRLLQVMG